MHWPFAWSHVGLQFNVVLGVFEVLHFGVRSSELSHFDLQINRKVWDSGKLSHSNQLRLLELLLSSLVMWHVFFFGSSVQPLQYAVNMPCTEVLTAIAFGKAYTLTVLSDIGAFPRPGENGRLTARQGLWPDLKDVSKMNREQRENHPIHRQLTEMQVQLSWDAAGYIPTGHQLKQSLTE